MKKILLAFALVVSSLLASAQCNTNNATDCRCKDSTQTDCDLLPDIGIGQPPFYILDDDFGMKEFAQSGNPDTIDDGRLYVTVSTPNPGFGPLEIFTTDTFVCGTDTIIGTPPSICPDGITYPRILVMQRIYHKSGNLMTSYTRPAGTMTYHPAHSHMHVDNWGNYTLRTRDSLESNPLNWPLLGAGTKLAFCVMDYGTCPGYANHCLDSAGNPLNNSSDHPNYGLGGGNYDCSSVVQGISSGYVDIYWTTLPGMYIDIPPGLCNGEYWVVCEVDPNQNFLEEREDNNVYAAPFILKRQLPNPAFVPLNVNISNSKVNLCQGETVTLSAFLNMPNVSYLWSNGATTAFTTISTAGTYTVNVTNQCGTGTSLPVVITSYQQPSAPIGQNDTIPVPGSAMLYASSSLNVLWYDQPSGGSPVATGNLFATPNINVSTTFYAETEEVHSGSSFNTGLADNLVAGSGSFSSTNQSLFFDCYNSFRLHTVDVYASSNGNVTIELRDSNSALLQSFATSLVTGLNTLTLDFDIVPGKNYRLTRTGSDLYRNNSGTNPGYPFTIPNVCTITGTTAGSGYYYFFYNWEVRMPGNVCKSTRIPVEAVVSFPNSIADVVEVNSFRVYPNPAKSHATVSFNLKETKAAIEFIDALGKIVLRRDIISNSGVVNETFDIGKLGSGIYNIHVLSSGKNFYRKLVID